MTLGECAGALLQAYIDQVDLDMPEYMERRRAILSSVPAECRFIGKDGKLAYLPMVQAMLDKAEADWQ